MKRRARFKVVTEERTELLIAIVVGVFIFVTDFIYGWLTFLTGPFPVIFVMAFIIGLIAGNGTKGILATTASWAIGLGIVYIFAPILLADFMGPDTTELGMIFETLMWPLRGYYDFFNVGNVVQAIGLVIVSLFLTPLMYLFSLGIGGVGGVAGKFVRKQMSNTGMQEDAHQPSSA
jgi:hypothetical protein